MLPEIIQFLQLTHAFQQVKRQMLVVGQDEFENDAEHSFQLALTGWYLAETCKLNLDVAKVFKYALAHDLVEVYAGDTGFFSTDLALKESQSKREAEAAQLIKKKFPEFTELHYIIANYESRLDDESKFIYALDKILPVLNNYIDQGRSWKRDSITLEQVIEGKSPKIAVSPDIDKIWLLLRKELEKDQAKFFSNKQ